MMGTARIQGTWSRFARKSPLPGLAKRLRETCVYKSHSGPLESAVTSEGTRGQGRVEPAVLLKHVTPCPSAHASPSRHASTVPWSGPQSRFKPQRHRPAPGRRGASQHRPLHHQELRRDTCSQGAATSPTDMLTFKKQNRKIGNLLCKTHTRASKCPLRKSFTSRNDTHLPWPSSWPVLS